MAILVFLTFLSLIVNQYVPVWEQDSEASHMATAVGQFGGIKSAIDFQILAAQTAFNSGQLFVPTTTSVAVTLGIDGVPIFAAPTLGTLTSTPDPPPTAPAGSSFNVYFRYSLRGVATPVWQNSSGLIDLNVGNRYFVAQRVAYENGAVIRAQSDGQTIRAGPVFAVSRSATNVSLAFELVNLYGSGGVTGTTTEVVDTKVFGVNMGTYTGILGQGIWINQTSPYGLAWYNFMNTTLNQGLGASGVFVRTPLSMSFTTAYYSLILNFNNLTNLYGLSVFIKNNPLTPSFTLQQAWVNVGVGDQSTVGP